MTTVLSTTYFAGGEETDKLPSHHGESVGERYHPRSVEGVHSSTWGYSHSVDHGLCSACSPAAGDLKTSGTVWCSGA